MQLSCLVVVAMSLVAVNGAPQFFGLRPFPTPVVVPFVAPFVAPLETPKYIPLIHKTETTDALRHQYELSLETANGIRHVEHARYIPGPEGNVLGKTGTVSYISPEGRTITLSYVADENGFRPSGDHLPKSVVA